MINTQNPDNNAIMVVDCDNAIKIQVKVKFRQEGIKRKEDIRDKTKCRITCKEQQTKSKPKVKVKAIW